MQLLNTPILHEKGDNPKTVPSSTQFKKVHWMHNLISHPV
jgi:hypothetical protein